MATPTTPPQAGLSPALPCGSRLNDARWRSVGATRSARAGVWDPRVYRRRRGSARAARVWRSCRYNWAPGLSRRVRLQDSCARPCSACSCARAWPTGGLRRRAGALRRTWGLAERIVLHGNAKSETAAMTLERRVGLIAIDNFDERIHSAGVFVGRSLPGGNVIRGDARSAASTTTPPLTGQADSKFGFAMAYAPEAIARIESVDGLRLRGLHAHIGSQLLESSRFAARLPQKPGGPGDFSVRDSAVGSACATPRSTRAPVDPVRRRRAAGGA